MSKRALRRKARSWGRRQLYSLFSSIGTLVSHKLATLMTLLVLGIAMALPLGLFVVVENLRSIDLQQSEWGSVTVFFDASVDSESAAETAHAIEQRNAEVRLVSPEEGMAEFSASSGFSSAADLFDENPLPWVAILTPGAENEQPLEAWVSEWQAWLEQREGVDLVQVDHKWLQRLAGLLALGRGLMTVLTVLFSLAVVVVVANTIRLDVASRSEEIEVMSMVGANNGFIRQPFLYSGFWYGMLGALLALVLMLAAIFYLQSPLEQLLEAYGSQYLLKGLGVQRSLLVLLSGGFLGLCGAFLSVQRHLRLLAQGHGIGL
ncbi:MAG TPA: permease-like cell division protein FtsX [Xanthomonadales bacterium]|nr:permease-like cell division protein FtsX [Xanthomonadales bacterium]